MRCSDRNTRRGNILVLTVLMLTFMLALAAMVVDYGYMTVVKTELRRSADSAAIAAACELIKSVDQNGAATPVASLSGVGSTAGELAAFNPTGNLNPTLGVSDVAVGRLVYPFNVSQPLDTREEMQPYFNSVRVKVQRTNVQNGPVGLFFAKALGMGDREMQEEAIAAFYNNCGGFREPPEGEYLSILPITVRIDIWRSLLDGTGGSGDLYRSSGTSVTCGADGVTELNIYPDKQGAGAFGTVDIGDPKNDTPTLDRQIRRGINKTDMEELVADNRSLQFNENGQIPLNSETGISNGIKDALASIVSKTRVIPLYEYSTGTGNNLDYYVVAFAGVRVMHVDMQGNPKKVIVQPANVMLKYTLPASGATQRSYSVYSSPYLIK